MCEQWYETVEQAIEQSQKYLYSFIVLREKIQLGEWNQEKAQQLKDSYKTEGMIEARFFSQEGEIHIFQREEGFCCYEIIDERESDIDSIIKEYDSKIGKTLQVKKYIQYDEDGQAEVAKTRFYSLQ